MYKCKRIMSHRVVMMVLFVCVSALPAQAGEQSKVQFNRDIRPIVSDTCFKCHGFDPNHREAGLRLDVREQALAEREGIRPIVPGDPDASEVYHRLTTDDPEKKMPPPDSGKQLSNAQIDTMRRWIEQGAQYEKHWSFIEPKRVDPPAVENDTWVRNPIDRFILARLKREGLTPSPEADKLMLIRRATLDLTGVPPTLDEIERFMADDSPDAYEKLIDRLLASPRYGERMAQPWLDAARYADTMGYQADWERQQWRWRSWVIDAYNRNLPFDQFTIQQLAGDLLEDPTTEQLIATGFNRNHRINDENGIIPAEYLVEYVVDRVETTSATWMGLTMGCARCHDHKYDPITQKDFYRFFAIFHNVPEKGKDGRSGRAQPFIRVAKRGMQTDYEKAQQRVATAKKNLDSALAKLAPQRKAWIETTAAKLAAAESPWQVTRPADLQATGAVDFEPLDDDSTLASGDNLQFPNYTIELAPRPGRLTGVRLEALRHESLTKGSLSPGNGNFVLTDFRVEVQRDGRDEPSPVRIAAAKADYAQDNWPVAHAIDNKPKTGWAVDGHRKIEDRTAIFNFAEPITLAEGDRLIVHMHHESVHARHAIGRFRLALTGVDHPDFTNTLGLPGPVASALKTPADKRNDKQNQQLAQHFASQNPQAKSLAGELDRAEKALDAFTKKHTTFVMVMREMDKPRPTHVLNRGAYDDPGEKVSMGLPTDLLGKLPEGEQPDRLGLARWLVSGKHPLTGRVIVNRYWAMLFGTGLVKTAEDFGFQGEYPSHPDLLDWLATEYPRIGWDTKAMLKLIMTSATYRQASTWTDTLRERDPHNRLLARQSRLRLPAETIRDQALFASGLLVEKIGGPSVKPYQPPGLWSEVSFQSKNRTTDFYEQDTGDKLYRRSIYTFWKRTMPPPTMATFDAPTREMCTLSRPRTNTPLQALALMNDVTYVEACRALAGRVIQQSGDDAAARIDQAFRLLLTRPPHPEERKILTRGYNQRLDHYRANPSAAKQLINEGESKPTADTDPIELAALTTVVMNILNLDETITRE